MDRADPATEGSPSGRDHTSVAEKEVKRFYFADEFRRTN